MKRKHISLKRKLASTLLELDRLGVYWERAIPHEKSKHMSDAQIVAMFDWDHGIPHSEGGSDEAWNLQPMLRQVHAEKTAKQDVPRIAKNKRVQRKQKLHEAIMGGADRHIIDYRPKRKIASRPFPKTKRKFKS